MLKVLKKNQIIVLVIALMLVTAGYLNYSSNQKDKIQANANVLDMAGIGDATLVNSNGLEEQENNIDENTVSGDITNTINPNSNTTNEEGSNQDSNNIIENTITTNAMLQTDEYFANSRLSRDRMYSQTIESYQKILDSTNADNSQKAIATQEIKKINDTQNAIMIVENLIKTKGFEDSIILVNQDSVNAIIKAEELTPDQIAQIQNIISRELKAEIEQIHITNK